MFLQQNGYILPPDDNDTSAQKKFNAFLVQTLENSKLDPTSMISPQEVGKRSLIFNVMDVIITLMKAMQQNVGEEAALMNFYAKYQAQYVDMMSRSFFYIGGSTDTFVPNQNPSLFTLGYGKLSLQDIASYVITNQTSFGFGQHIANYATSTQDAAPFVFQYVPPAPNSTTASFELTSPFYGTLMQYNFSTTTPLQQAIQGAAQAAANLYYANPELSYAPAPIITNIATQLATSSVSTSINFSSIPDPPEPPSPFVFSGGAPPLFPLAGEPAYDDFTISNALLSPDPIVDVSFSNSDTTAEREAKIEAAINGLLTNPAFPNIQQQLFGDAGIDFQQLINPNLNVVPGIVFTNQFSIPWPFNFVNTPGDIDDTLASNDQQSRASANQTLQTYIQADSARNEVLAQQSDNARSNLTASQQAISASINIFETSIKQLSNIIDAIFNLG